MSISRLDWSDVEIEQALRHAVQSICQTGDLQNLTVNHVRKAAAKNLKLPEEFFKQHQTWKDKSKGIIEEEAETQADAASDGEHVGSRASSSRLTPVATSNSTKAGTPQPRNKRSSPVKAIARKRQKLDKGSEADKPKKASEKGQQDMSEDSRSQDNVVISERYQEASALAKDDQSESDMSEVLDDEPKKKRKRRPSGSGISQTKTLPKPKEKLEKKTKHERVDPSTEEIKRLQGWLVKCGMRKMWYKELAPYDSSKAKIRHLKDMLAEVGMTGRYSLEKATQVREARELKSELEAVQEGAKQWGKEDSDSAGTMRPKRRVAKGLQNLDFLNGDDGEETD